MGNSERKYLPKGSTAEVLLRRGLPSRAQGVAGEASGLQEQRPAAELSQEGTSAGSLAPTEAALEQGEDSSRSHAEAGLRLIHRGGPEGAGEHGPWC